MYMSQNAEMLSKLIHLTMKLLKAVLTDSISQTLDNPSLFTQKKTAYIAPHIRNILSEIIPPYVQ